jgi:hypothetical protein
MSKKIALTVIPGENPVIEVNGVYLKTEYACLSRLTKEITQVITETQGLKNNLLGVTAWGGEITGHLNATPPQNLRESISFTDIVLHKTGVNTREHYLTDRIFRILALLVWHQSEHFRQIKQSHIFECLVCGGRQLSSNDHILPPIPSFCESPDCYSHEILTILDPEYEFAGNRE